MTKIDVKAGKEGLKRLDMAMSVKRADISAVIAKSVEEAMYEGERRVYCLGFAFKFPKDGKGPQVCLIRKRKPDWQKGLLNGVGGKVELSDDTPAWAMAREFKEETGAFTTVSNWREFCVMRGTGWKVHCFLSLAGVDKVKSTTKEVVKWYAVADLLKLKTIPNVKWLVSMALDPNVRLGEVREFGS